MHGKSFQLKTRNRSTPYCLTLFILWAAAEGLAPSFSQSSLTLTPAVFHSAVALSARVIVQSVASRSNRAQAHREGDAPRAADRRSRVTGRPQIYHRCVRSGTPGAAPRTGQHLA